MAERVVGFTVSCELSAEQGKAGHTRAREPLGGGGVWGGGEHARAACHAGRGREVGTAGRGWVLGAASSSTSARYVLHGTHYYRYTLLYCIV